MHHSRCNVQRTTINTENLVMYIWSQIAHEIPEPAYLYSIKLQETPTIYTEYYGPEGVK